RHRKSRSSRPCGRSQRQGPRQRSEKTRLGFRVRRSRTCLVPRKPPSSVRPRASSSLARQFDANVFYGVETNEGRIARVGRVVTGVSRGEVLVAAARISVKRVVDFVFGTYMWTGGV